MLKKTKEYILQNKMIKPQSTVIAAVSGGADSVCMLHILCELQAELEFEIRVVHVEHGIRGQESIEDAYFVRTLCEKMGISFEMESVDVPAYVKKTGVGIEEAARYLRYGVLEREAKRYNAVVAVAHHQEDNAETVIFQMLRGSGVKGLTGIHPVSQKRDITYIRPLLFASRELIESYLKENAQSYVTDATNMDTDYSRNKLRHEVFPLFAQVNGRAVEHINESAYQLGIMYDYFSGMVKNACSEIISTKKGDVYIAVDSFLRQHMAMRQAIAQEAIYQAAGKLKDIGSVHIGLLVALAGQQSGKEIDLPYGIKARKSYDTIILSTKHRVFNETAIKVSELPEINQSMSLELGEADMIMTLRGIEFNSKMDEIPKKPYTKWFDYDKMKSGFEIRKRRAGDYMIVDKEGHHKKLKQYFVNEKIPLEKRNSLWLLARESEIYAVMGYRSGQSAVVSPDTERVLEVTLDGILDGGM